MIWVYLAEVVCILASHSLRLNHPALSAALMLAVVVMVCASILSEMFK